MSVPETACVEFQERMSGLWDEGPNSLDIPRSSAAGQILIYSKEEAEGR